MSGGRAALRAGAIVLALCAAPWPARAAPDASSPDSLLRRAQAMSRARHFAAAESLARAALPGLERAYGPSSPRVADALDAVLTTLSQPVPTLPAAAESLAARAVALRRALGDSVALAHTLGRSGAVLGARTHVSAARAQAAEAVRLLRVHAPRDSFEIAATEALLGRLGLMSEDPRAAEEHYRAALAICDRQFGPDHPESVPILYGIASAAVSRNDPRSALPLYQHILAIVEREPDIEAIDLSSTLDGLVQTCTNTGDWALGRRYADRNVAFADSAFGMSDGNTALAHARAADLIAFIGDLAEAHRQAELAVEIGRRAFHEPHLYMVSILSISGEIDYDLHRLDDAIARVREALAVREALSEPGDVVSANKRVRLALMESERGHPQLALAAVQPLWAGQARRGLRWQLRTEDVLAETHRRLGHAAIAESLVRHVVAVYDSALGPRSALTLERKADWAGSLYDLGEHARALALGFEVEATSRSILQEAIGGLSDREALSFEGEMARGLDVVLTLAADPSGLTLPERRAAWDAVARGRLAVAAERADQRWSARSDDPDVARRQAELAAARDSLSRLAAGTLAGGRSDSLLALLTAARRRRDAAERALGEVSAAYRQRRPARDAGIADAIAALPEGAALVSFVRYQHRRIPVAADSGLGRASEQRYVALVRAPGSDVTDVVPLGDAAGLEDLVARWIERTSHPVAATDRVGWRRYRELGAALRERVWDPIARRLAGAGRVYVVPDGALAAIDLAALPVGADAWLVETGPTLVMLSAERDLVHDGEAPSGGHGLLALADPAYDRGALAEPGSGPLALADESWHSRLRGADSLQLAPLPASAGEARAVAAAWQLAPGTDHEARVLVGAQASEEEFKAGAPGRRVLHLATHGVSLAGRSVRIERGARGVGGVHVGSGPASAEEHDDLSALALAGAAHPDSTAPEDGWLTDEEVLTLDLAGVEWAVLSACASGAGDARGRETLQGLVRAFHLAGARTVIASLWDVDDRATRDWMERAYRARWVEGLATPDAVRAASRAVLAERRAKGESTHPFYWGAFVATGNGR